MKMGYKQQTLREATEQPLDENERVFVSFDEDYSIPNDKQDEAVQKLAQMIKLSNQIYNNSVEDGDIPSPEEVYEFYKTFAHMFSNFQLEDEYLLSVTMGEEEDEVEVEDEDYCPECAAAEKGEDQLSLMNSIDSKMSDVLDDILDLGFDHDDQNRLVHSAFEFMCGIQETWLPKTIALKVQEYVDFDDNEEVLEWVAEALYRRHRTKVKRFSILRTTSYGVVLVDDIEWGDTFGWIYHKNMAKQLCRDSGQSIEDVEPITKTKH